MNVWHATQRFARDPMGCAEEDVVLIKDAIRHKHGTEESIFIALYAKYDEHIVVHVIVNETKHFNVFVHEGGIRVPSTSTSTSPDPHTSFCTTDFSTVLKSLRCDVCDYKHFTPDDVLWTNVDDFDACENCGETRDDLQMCTVINRVNRYRQELLRSTGFSVAEDIGAAVTGT